MDRHLVRRGRKEFPPHLVRLGRLRQICRYDNVRVDSYAFQEALALSDR